MCDLVSSESDMQDQAFGNLHPPLSKHDVGFVHVVSRFACCNGELKS